MSGENGANTPKKPINDDALAVALGYSPTKDQAPRLLAKGQGWVAQQIIEIAEANGIEVRQDSDLAQILSQVDVNSEIPLEAFTLVAEMLSYVYQKNRVWPEGLGPNAGKPKGGGV